MASFDPKDRPPRVPAPRVGTEDLELGGGLAGPSEPTAAGVPLPPAPPSEAPRSPVPRVRTEDLDRLPVPADRRSLPDEPTGAAANDTMTLGAPVAARGRDALDDLPTREHLRDDGVIARGGFGSIHRAYDTRLLRQVAMKVLEKDNDKARGRFLEEGQICAQLEHPNIVPVHEAGTSHDGKPFFTMKLVRGLTLGRVVREAHQTGAGENTVTGAGSPGFHAALHQIIEIFLRVCDAVAFAHSKGVLHRDLKPDNIMVGTHGQVYLMDWGIAHVLGRGDEGGGDGEPPVRLASPKPPDSEGSVAGTPTYMAPEQAKGHVSLCNERTDVFSLGAILYFILTSTPPYRGKTTKEKLALAQMCEVERPERRAPHKRLPPGLCQIAMKAMAREPAERYPSATALRLDLERFLRGGWWFETRTFAPGEIVLREGEEGEEAFIITGGTAEAYRGSDDNPTLLSVMGPGDVFGEMAIFTDKRRTATVRATSPLSAMVVTRESVEHQFGADTWTGLIVKTLATRFRELDERTRARAGRPRPMGPSVRPAMQAQIPAALRTPAPTSPVEVTPAVETPSASTAAPSTAAPASAARLYSPEELGFEPEPPKPDDAEPPPLPEDASYQDSYIGLRPLTQSLNVPLNIGVGLKEPVGPADPWSVPANDSFLNFSAIAEELSESFRFGDDTLPRILDLLERRELDEAAQLYEASEGALSATLLGEAELNPGLARPLADLLERARDFSAAGRAFEIAGDLREAAHMYEQGDSYYAAAGCYRQLGELENAAKAFERGGDRPSALLAYEEVGVREGMADLLMREGRFAEAAEIYRDLGDLAREVEMLRLVPVYAPGRVEAALRLAHLYAETEQTPEAAQLLVDTLQSCESAWSDNRVAVAVIPLLLRLGRSDDARRVMAWAKAQTEGGEVPSLQELGEAAPPSGGARDDRETTAIREALRRVDPEAYQVLKKIPLFAELALVDMKDLYRACEERVFDAGTALIEAGRSPLGLFVVLEGQIDVRLDDGALLSRVGPGETLGEISLVTEGPATATARSLDRGRALFISKERFEHFLYHHEQAALRIHRLFNRILGERMTVLSGVTAHGAHGRRS